MVMPLRVLCGSLFAIADGWCRAHMIRRDVRAVERGVLRPARRAGHPIALCGAATATGTVADDRDVHRVGDGLYYNERLGANNVWDIEVDPLIVDEAAVIYKEGRRGSHAFAAIAEPGEKYGEIATAAGAFFAQRVSWRSNIAWVSADDERSLAAYEDLFARMRISERFAPVVPHLKELRLYSAFYVTRTWCDAMHGVRINRRRDRGGAASTTTRRRRRRGGEPAVGARRRRDDGTGETTTTAPARRGRRRASKKVRRRRGMAR
mmetsp:Transcript_16082/g.49816  ORF Transcript_16082/g.49816 Transcript_16082/m.49816 type:complete len:264 (+) Transcript_16082:177-968(+)